MTTDNKRETGARKPSTPTDDGKSRETSQKAAGNKPPNGIGNSEPVSETDAKTRHSNGTTKRHPATQEKNGAGPALARHSKDAGRQ